MSFLLVLDVKAAGLVQRPPDDGDILSERLRRLPDATVADRGRMRDFA